MHRTSGGLLARLSSTAASHSCQATFLRCCGIHRTSGLRSGVNSTHFQLPWYSAILPALLLCAPYPWQTFGQDRLPSPPPIAFRQPSCAAVVCTVPLVYAIVSIAPLDDISSPRGAAARKAPQRPAHSLQTRHRFPRSLDIPVTAALGTLPTENAVASHVHRSVSKKAPLPHSHNTQSPPPPVGFLNDKFQFPVARSIKTKFVTR